MRFFQKTICFFLITVLAFGALSGCGSASETAADPAVDRLNEFAATVMEEKTQQLGYPGNQDVQLTEFYKSDSSHG